MRHFQHTLTIVLIVAIAILAVWASNQYVWHADWTAGNRNSLTPASRQVLDAMDDQITFTAFAYPGPTRADIRTQLERYTRYRPGIELTFVDPAKNPQKVRELGIRRDGEVQVAYQDRTQTLNNLSEQKVTNALQRLSVAGEQWIVFLTGHDERSPEDDGESGYSTLAQELNNQGLKTQSLNLAESPRIPDNTAVLVVASPQKGLLPGEVELVRKYVENGGNLLWLDDPGPRYGLVPLADDLGIGWQKGTVIYPDFQQLGTGHPAIALVFNYPQHPITQRQSSITVYPFAGGLTAENQGNWQLKPLLRTPQRSWLETGSLQDQQVAFDEKADTAGPITMAFAGTRPRPGQSDSAASGKSKDTNQQQSNGSQQRAVVLADSDFLANAHINTLGNMQMGVSLFQWLTNRDQQISVTVPPAPDSSLNLAPWQGRIIWLAFVIVLPLLLLGIGVSRWWIRRRR